MILPLFHRLVPGCDEESEDLRGHYWVLLDVLSSADGSTTDTAKVVGVTSCRSGEGVSTIAASLAVAAASNGQGPVLLVDANLDRPAMHRLLGVKPAPGLAEALVDRLCSPVLQPSSVADLAVLAAGAAEICPARALTASSFAELLQGLQDRFVLVVVDMPPVEAGSLAVQLAGSLDGVLLVVEAERIRGEEVRQRKELLTRANASLLGAVLNKQRRYVPARLDRWI